MQQFYTNSVRFSELRNALLLRSVPIALIATGVGAAMSYANTKGTQQDDNFIFIIIPFMLLVVAYGLYRAIAMQKKLFDSYRLTFDNDYVTREQNNTPIITMPYSKIVTITRNHNGTFTIKGDSTLNVIGIPAQVSDYDQLESLLNGIKPVTRVTVKPVVERFFSVFSLLGVALMAIVYLASNKLLVGVGGSLLLALMVYSLVVIQRTKNVDNKTKRSAWWMLVVIVSILGTMYFKLFLAQ